MLLIVLKLHTRCKLSSIAVVGFYAQNGGYKKRAMQKSICMVLIVFASPFDSDSMIPRSSLCWLSFKLRLPWATWVAWISDFRISIFLRFYISTLLYFYIPTFSSKPGVNCYCAETYWWPKSRNLLIRMPFLASNQDALSGFRGEPAGLTSLWTPGFIVIKQLNQPQTKKTPSRAFERARGRFKLRCLCVFCDPVGHLKGVPCRS